MTARLAVLLAHPAGHSASPVMHGAAFAEAGIDARYEAWDVPPEGLERAVARLRAELIVGANVTVPHKEAVGAWLDGLRDAARAVGAVNLIVRDGDRLWGDNSDAAGFARSLDEAGVRRWRIAVP
jgi:Shikimate 5-dehydrogenase